jgi:geranylgeranyl reductase family protein
LNGFFAVNNIVETITIAGAGPAGATASLFLSAYGIKHTLIDKALFPRDKICGDALSGKVLPVLKKLNPDLINQLLVNNTNCVGSNGILFGAPNGKTLEVPFKAVTSSIPHAPGFVSKRFDFDYSLIQQLNPDYCDFKQGVEIKSVQPHEQGVHLTAYHHQLQQTFTHETALLIACDGAHSICNKHFPEHKLDPDHYCGGIRAYYQGVKGMHSSNFIELHFLKELLPGYFWIFPLPNGMANIGAGMLTKSISRKKINLKDAMLKAIAQNPAISSRFAGAKMIGKIEGWGLPLGSKRRALSGNRILLCGDAASMIDPFSGEGISNAMYCGMRAAEVVKMAVEQQDFSNPTLKAYDDMVYNRLWSELKLSHTLQKLCNYPWLFNFVVNKASRNETFRQTISCMFDDIDLRAKLRQPSFYFRMLFG